MRLALNILFVIALLLAIYILVPSSLFFRPIEAKYNPATHEITFIRYVRWYGDTMRARYFHTYLRGNGVVCLASGERNFVVGNHTDVIVPSIDAYQCLEDPTTIYYLSWNVLLFDIIPLRPVTFVKQDVYESSWFYSPNYVATAR